MSQTSPGGMWRPPGLPTDLTNQELAGFVYAVVEERIDDVLGLVVTEWPRANREQPIFVGADREYEIAVSTADLQSVLSKRFPVASRAVRRRVRRMPSEMRALRERRVEVGDAFAIPASLDEVAAAANSERQVEATAWVKGRVIDVTADAREAAKLATLRALAPPLDPKVEESLLADAQDRQMPETQGQ